MIYSMPDRQIEPCKKKIISLGEWKILDADRAQLFLFWCVKAELIRAHQSSVWIDLKKNSSKKTRIISKGSTTFLFQHMKWKSKISSRTVYCVFFVKKKQNNKKNCRFFYLKYLQ